MIQCLPGEGKIVCWHTRSGESLDGKQPHASEPNDREWWRRQERDGTETAMAKATHCERRGVFRVGLRRLW